MPIAILLAAALAAPQLVHRFNGPMPTGVTVSAEGRLFVNFPRWGDNVPASVIELKGNREIPYPNAEVNRDDQQHAENHFICVQSVVVDPNDRLWVLDAGAPKLGLTIPNGPKLVGIDLRTNKIVKWIRFPLDVVTRATYLNDVRFDLRDGEGFAFITDSGDKSANGIIVVDLRSGQSWRRLAKHPSVKPDPGLVVTAESKPLLIRKPHEPPQKPHMGSDGIALSADGKRLFYCPLISHHLYSVDLQLLEDQAHSNVDVETSVRDEGRKPASDGLLGSTTGLFATDYEHHRVIKRGEGRASWTTAFEVPSIYWTDTLSMSRSGDIYMIANELQRQGNYHYGKDLRQKPYVLVRARVGGGPVLLK